MLVKLVFLVIFQTALCEVTKKPNYDVGNYEVMGHHFESFIKTYKRQYSNDQKRWRFHIFIENVKEINKANKKHTLTTFDINKFADMTKEEQQGYLGFRPSDTDPDLADYGKCSLVNATSTKNSPKEWNWVAEGAVSPVQDQAKCGSCWAFSATGLVESRSWKNGNQVVLSEQQLVDCDKTSNGCFGGLMTSALTYLMDQGGQELLVDYPYRAVSGKCSFKKEKAAAKVTGCTAYNTESEEELQDLLYHEGPLAIAVDAQHWPTYSTDIFVDCRTDGLNHGVLLVGYGTDGTDDKGVDYWLIKNSWGDDWGHKGFIKMKRGVGCCGIGSDPIGVVSAVVEQANTGIHTDN